MADLNFLSTPVATQPVLDPTGGIGGGLSTGADPLSNSPVFPAGTTTGADSGNFFNFPAANTIAPGAVGTTPTGIVPAGTSAVGSTTGTGNFFNFQPPNVFQTAAVNNPVANGAVPAATTGGNTFGFPSFAVPSITQPEIPIGVPNANLTPAFQGPGPIATANGIPSNISMGGGNMINVGNGVAGGSVLQPIGGTGSIVAPVISGGPLGALATAGPVTALARADAGDLGLTDLPLDDGLADFDVI